MPRLAIRHRTTYRYQRPVGLLPHRLMLRPLDSHDLRLHGASLAVTPAARSTRWAHDVFGNSVCLLDWGAALRTDTLEIVSELDLTHYPSGAAPPIANLDPAAERFPFSYAADEIPDLARLAERQLADPTREVDAWARRFVEGGATTLGLLEAMTRAIQRDFGYEARHAEGTQAPTQTLVSGRGACRDFALLMMEALRSLGLAARFVSGYLYSDTGDATQGGGATHAWVSVYLPGAGWVEYDPTNGLMAGRNLIRICTARTPEQALPVTGGFLGAPGDAGGLTVDVAVTRAEDAAALAA